LLGNIIQRFHAEALAAVGRATEGAKAYGETLALAEQSDDPLTAYECLVGMAALAIESGQLDDTERMVTRAEKSPAAAQASPDSLNLTRARLLQARGRTEQAKIAFSTNVETAKPGPDRVAALMARAEFQLAQGKLDEASQDATTALEAAQRLQGGLPYSARTGGAFLVEGTILARQGQAERSQAHYRSALLHLSHTVDDAHPRLVALRDLMARQ
jgi:tetratricopeptide (TPR) repeat protein